MKKYIILGLLMLFSSGAFASATACNPIEMGALTPMVDAGYAEVKDSKQTLMACAFMVTTAGFGASNVFDDLKCCKEAVEENCSFRKSKKRVSGPPECKLFAPWAM